MTCLTSSQCREPGAGAAGPPGLGRIPRRDELVGGGGGGDLPRPAGPGGQGPAGCRHRAVQKYQPTNPHKYVAVNALSSKDCAIDIYD